ncbi:MAG: PIN domain-containing protein [Nanoarchaeota archaeon]
MVNYYFDTSIWIDLFEERIEPGLDKGKLAIKLVDKISEFGDKILYSGPIIKELIDFGYSPFEIKSFFLPFRRVLIYIHSNKKQAGRAKDLAYKRNIPLFDALHAIIARDSMAILISRDRDFKKLKDIVLTKAPEDLI